MIDIHSHIIFDVDDGPKTVSDSLALLEESYKQGVRTIVATSHRRKGMFETPEEKIAKNFEVVQQLAQRVADDLRVYYGAELYFTSDIPGKLETGQVPTMAGTRFALIEFSGATPWREIHDAASKVLMLGLTPIIAHIERYNALEFNKERVKELINMGCYTQVNAAHVLKAKLFGDKLKLYKKRAKYFLDEDIVHLISSDMHNMDNRKPHMAEAYQLIEKTYGKGRARRLFQENAQTLLENNYI